MHDDPITTTRRKPPNKKKIRTAEYLVGSLFYFILFIIRVFCNAVTSSCFLRCTTNKSAGIPGVGDFWLFPILNSSSPPPELQPLFPSLLLQASLPTHTTVLRLLIYPNRFNLLCFVLFSPFISFTFLFNTFLLVVCFVFWGLPFTPPKIPILPPPPEPQFQDRTKLDCRILSCSSPCRSHRLSARLVIYIHVA